MVISIRSTRVKQFLYKKVKFIFCRSKNTTKLLLSGNHNSKVTRHKNIRAWGNINILKNIKQTFLFTYLKNAWQIGYFKANYVFESRFEIKSNL